VVIDFEEVPATSIFRTSEGAADCLRTVTTYEISSFQKLQLTNYLFFGVSQISICLYYVGHFPSSEEILVYLVFRKLFLIPILADGFSLYSEIILILRILPMAAIGNVISEHEQ
jgi:hypothetical protein